MELLGFPKILALLAAKTATPWGGELARLLAPLADPGEVKAAQTLTEEAVQVLRLGEISLAGAEDIRPSLVRAAKGGRLSATELLAVVTTLQAGERAKTTIQERGEGKYPLLRKITASIRESGELGAELDRCLVPPGEVADGASPLLGGLRREIKAAEVGLRRTLEETARRMYERGYLQEPAVVFREGRGCLPVKQEYREAVGGVVHAASNTGATLFIEPKEAFKEGDRLRAARSREAAEVERILDRLSALVGAAAPELEGSALALAKLDLALAKGRLSASWNGLAPVFNDKGYIILKGAKHPLLGTRAVPISLEFGDRFLTLVITGPNTGGKTAALKTVGLLVLLAQTGLQLPVHEASLPIFQQVLADIGDAQDLERATSTFSSHLSRLMVILAAAGPSTLALLDEMGAGTDPEEGAALAQAILEALTRAGCRTVATTHHGQLKIFAHEHPRMENAAVGFDPVTGTPTYRLTVGVPGESEALAIAKGLGLDEGLITRAKEFLGPDKVRLGELLRHLEEERSLQAKARVQAEAAAREASRLAQEAAQAERETAERCREAYAQARAVLGEARREAENALKKMRREAQKEELESWRERMKAAQGRLPSTKAIDDVGDLKAKLKAGLEGVGGQMIMEKRQGISSELDLRGELADDALERLDKYLDDCLLAGVARVRIIHGKGTGALRAAVKEYLLGHGGIKAFRSGENGEGGAGVTVADLE